MATIQGIYLALFGRPADPAGLTYFNGLTNNGANLAGIANLAGQPEYTARFTGMSNTQIINSIYQSLFGRDGETAGVSFWLEKLTSGALTINNIAIAILDGAQGPDKTTIDAKLAAAALFTTHLDLPAEQNAYNTTTSALIKTYLAGINTTKAATGTEIDAVIQSMLTSGGQGPDGGQNPGGGGEGPVNQPAVITGPSTGDVYEDGRRPVEPVEPVEKIALAIVEDEEVVETAEGKLSSTDPDGTVGFTASTTKGTYGTLTIDAAGAWQFVLDNKSEAVQALGAKQTETDTFTVSSADGTTHEIKITVHGVNDEATFVNGEESYTVVDGTASGTVTVSDIDSDETFGAASGTAGTYGNFKFTSTENGGEWTYKLAATDGAQKAAYDALPDGEAATETLTVTSADGTTHEIVVSLTGINDAPVATDDSGSTDEDTPLQGSVSVLANDTDVDNNSLTAVLVSGPSHGTLNFNADGTYVYTPNSNYHGADSFTYEANDGSVDSNTATVNLTINAVNDKPVITTETTPDVTSVEEGNTAVTLATGVSVSDAEDSGLTVSLTGANASYFTLEDGVLKLNTVDFQEVAAAQATFTPSLSVTLSATDSGGATAEEKTFTVSITDKVETVTATNTNNAVVSKADSYGAWIINGHSDSGKNDNGIDTLTGGKAADVITGKGGADTLFGGLGNDTFVFAAGDSTSDETDVIMDWNSGDKIDLKAIDAKEDWRDRDRDRDWHDTGKQNLTYGGEKSNPGYGEVSWFHWRGDTYIVADTTHDNGSDTSLTIKIAGEVTLTAADFVLAS